MYNLRFPYVSKEEAGRYRVSLSDAISKNNDSARTVDANLVVKGKLEI